ncbi:MAG TPA: YceH family protein [Burkholderiales bacterium]|nr:YceH family protein [Burkholderiales bacterium]
MSLPTLSLIETRVLGTLAEKQRTVPDAYPLTLNSLVSGCNQKTSRDPVMDAGEAEVQAALDSLKRYSLVIESSGGRVARYAHNVERVLQLGPEALAVLTALMLRGPQTAGELRIACERLHHFESIPAVEAALKDLAGRSLALELPRLPGSRESRWSHLLSGAPAADAPAAPERPAADASLGEVAALKANVARLESDVEQLKGLVGRIAQELGIKR